MDSGSAMRFTVAWASLWIFTIACGFFTVDPVVSRKSCPENCSKFGTCNEELGRFATYRSSLAGLHEPLACSFALCRCDCPWNYTGPACTIAYRGFCVKRVGVDNPINTCKDGNPTLCVNACNGRGDCKGGFCHCQSGMSRFPSSGLLGSALHTRPSSALGV